MSNALRGGMTTRSRSARRCAIASRPLTRSAAGESVRGHEVMPAERDERGHSPSGVLAVAALQVRRTCPAGVGNRSDPDH